MFTLHAPAMQAASSTAFLDSQKEQETSWDAGGQDTAEDINALTQGKNPEEEEIQSPDKEKTPSRDAVFGTGAQALAGMVA